jgi:WD40 repeat protein
MAAIYYRRMPDIASGSSRVLVFGRRFLAAVFWVCAWGPLHAEVPTGRAIESRLASRSISATVASPAAERLFIGGHDGFVEVVSTSTGAVQGRWDIGSPITHIAIDRLAKYVVLATKERDVSIHSAETGEVLLNWKHGQAVTSVSVSGDGRVFASSSRDNTVSIRDMSQWPPSETSFRLPSIARAISLDEKGATILLGLNNGAAELRDLRSRETILSWSHDRMVTSVSFSPDGEHVISASADHKLKITNKKSRSTVVAYEGSRPIQDLKFLSQGRQILIASADEAILLDILRQERIQRWRVSGWVRALASIDNDDSFVLLADDGTYLLSLRSESGGLRRLQQDGDGDRLSGGSTFGAASTAVLPFDRSRHDNVSISVATTRPDDVGLFSIEIRSKEPLSEIHVNGQPRELSSPNFYSGEFYAQLGRQVFDLSITDRSGRSIERTLIIDRDVDHPKPSKERLDPTRLGVSKPRDAVAVIIGIEKYKSVGKASFADRDAKVFYD